MSVLHISLIPHIHQGPHTSCTQENVSACSPSLPSCIVLTVWDPSSTFCHYSKVAVLSFLLFYLLPSLLVSKSICVNKLIKQKDSFYFYEKNFHTFYSISTLINPLKIYLLFWIRGIKQKRKKNL